MLVALPFPPRSRRILWRLAILLLFAAAALPGQTLARRGWAGSGITVDPWWRHATFYQIDPLTFQDSDGDGFGDLHGIADHLDYLQTLGVDALILSPLSAQLPQPGEKGQQPALEKIYGGADDLDLLQSQASLRHMRLLVDLSIDTEQSSEQVVAMGRFWLSRGIGGLRLVAGVPHAGVPGQLVREREERIQAVSRLCATYPGQRVVLVDLASVFSTPSIYSRRRTHPSQATLASSGPALLRVDRGLARLAGRPGLDASALRAVVLGEPGVSAFASVLASDGPEEPRSWSRLGGGEPDSRARILAAALFLGRGSPLLFYGQEIGMAQAALTQERKAGPAPMAWGEPGITWLPPGPDAATANVAVEEINPASLLNWYRTLARARQSNATLRGGSLSLLDTGNPEVVVWLRRGPRASAPAVIVAVNLSAVPVVFSLASQLRRAGLNPLNGLHPLASSSPGIASSYSAASILVAPGAVLVSQWIPLGLESTYVALPRRSRRRR